MKIKRPVLRYYGGKWRIANWIISFFPEHKVYVEPYGGAASVLLQKPKSFAEIYNDLDDQILNMFRVLQDPKKTEKLIRKLEVTPYSRKEHQKAYRYIKESVEQARRTIIRSFMSYSSDGATRDVRTGFRSRNFNSGTYCAIQLETYPKYLRKAIKRLRSVTLENLPALEIIKKYDTDVTLFYCDPPYLQETRSTYNGKYEGYRFDMMEEDHRELLEAIQNVKGMVILSGYENDLYNDYLPGWSKFKHKTRGQTSLGGSKETEEVLWISPRTIDVKRLPLFEE